MLIQISMFLSIMVVCTQDRHHRSYLFWGESSMVKLGKPNTNHQGFIATAQVVWNVLPLFFWNLVNWLEFWRWWFRLRNISISSVHLFYGKTGGFCNKNETTRGHMAQCNPAPEVTWDSADFRPSIHSHPIKNPCRCWDDTCQVPGPRKKLLGRY